jgi:hypothetical protein
MWLLIGSSVDGVGDRDKILWWLINVSCSLSSSVSDITSYIGCWGKWVVDGASGEVEWCDNSRGCLANGNFVCKNISSSSSDEINSGSKWKLLFFLIVRVKGKSFDGICFN